MLKTSSMLAFAAILIALTGCRRDEVEVVRSSGIDDFIPQYNRFIKNWLEEQLVENVKAVRKAEQEMLSLEGEEREVVEKRLLNLKREEDKLKFRLDFGDFFRFGKPEEVPADLVWEDGMDQEEIGDPRAKKGGSFRVDIRTFPPDT